MANLVGQQFGKYLLTRFLGDGGFAEVYVGKHKELGTEAAIKVLKTSLSAAEVQNFRTEATRIAKLRHHHIVRVFDFDMKGNTPFMVMDYASHGTLEQRHPQGTPVPLNAIVSYVKQVAEALQYAHNAKIIHRDVKSANMLIGDDDEVLLSDFGIAVIAHSTHSMILQDKVGTLAYMAPEQLDGRPTIFSDQYALGIVVYEWLCGEVPFKGTILEILNQHHFVAPPSLQGKIPTISSTLESVVSKALAKDPHQRFSSVKDFADALEQAFQSQQPTILPKTPRPSPVKLPPTVQVAAPSFAPPSLLFANHGHDGEIAQVVWSSDSRYIASRGMDQTVQVWETTNGKNVFTYTTQSNFLNSVLGGPISITAATWSPVKPYLAITRGDGTLQVWDVVTRTKISTFTSPFKRRPSSNSGTRMIWSPNGIHIASQFPVQGSNTVWNVIKGEHIFSTDYYANSRLFLPIMEWSPNGKYIALTAHNAWNVVVDVWDITARGKLFTFSSYNQVNIAVWSPNGNYLALGGAYDEVQIDSAITGERIITHKSQHAYGHGEPIKAVAWSPNEEYIASFDNYRIINIYKALTQKVVQTYRGLVGFSSSSGRNSYYEQYSLTWLPDNQRLLFTGEALHLLNVISGVTLFTYSGSHYIASLSPDGTYIATASQEKSLQLWDASSGKHVFTFPGFSGGVKTIAWSPNGAYLVSASGDGMIRVWQVK